MDMKKRFAEACLRNPNNNYQAAMELTAGEPVAAMRMVSEWQYDPEVIAYKNQLIEERGEEAFLPSKASLVHRLMHRLDNCNYDEDYVKLMRLVADMRGMIEKPGVVVNNNITTNKVMNIPVFVNHLGQPATPDQWEQSLIEQQRTLVEPE